MTELRLTMAVCGLLMATLVASVGAQTVSGIGSRHCSAFNFALHKESDLALDSYVAWSQGFISAFNWANARQRDVRIDAAAIVHWLGQFCGARPDDSIYDAVVELIRLNAR